MVSIDISQKAFEQLQVFAQSTQQTMQQMLDDLLQQSNNNLYQAIFEKAKDAILVINDDDAYIAVNEAACELLGYAREELLTLKPENLVAEDDIRHQQVRDNWQQQGYADSIYRLRKKNKQYIYVEILAVANVIDGQHVAIMRDATEQINLIRALTETKQSVKAIFADTETPIFSLNISDKLLFTFHDLSVAYLQTFKQDYDTLVNQNPKDIASLPSAYVSLLLESAKKCFTVGYALRYQSTFTLDDKTIVLLTQLNPLRDANGLIYRIIGLCLDVSDKIAYEEEHLRAFNLNSELSKAQELNRYKAEVTTLLAHEFQTPLSVINTSLYMMEKNSDGQPIEHRLGQITRQVNLLQQLMQRIIDLNQGAMMEQELDLAEVNFPEFVNNIINDLITSFPDGAPITFTATIPENLIVTDTELMRQIVTNIVSNALKYSAQSKLPIQVTCLSDNRHFSFVVKDQGIGIPKEDLETIFDFFKRGRNAENHQGIGVGLMVVKQAVHRLGGAIVIASEEGEGTTVTIDLPLAAVYLNTST